MKNNNKLALLLSLGALLPFAASAKTLEQSYIESCKKGTDIPVPVSVVSPHVDGYDIGQTVQVEFVVDTTGNTTGVSIKSASDRAFILPVRVVDAADSSRFAAN